MVVVMNKKDTDTDTEKKIQKINGSSKESATMLPPVNPISQDQRPIHYTTESLVR